MLVVGTVLTLTACEEMVDNDQDEPSPRTSGRCDADPDWYINLPIVDLDLGGQLNPLPAPTPDDPRAVDWSEERAIRDRYEGKTFTLERFKQLQRDLFATGLLREGDQKWGIEFYVIPDLPRSGYADPRTGVRAGGCLGVRLHGDAQTYYPQEIQDRPLRLVR